MVISIIARAHVSPVDRSQLRDVKPLEPPIWTSGLAQARHRTDARKRDDQVFGAGYMAVWANFDGREDVGDQVRPYTMSCSRIAD